MSDETNTLVLIATIIGVIVTSGFFLRVYLDIKDLRDEKRRGNLQ